MSIYIADSVVTNQSLLDAGITGNNPRIGWRNIVTETNILADEEDTDHPVIYASNPATYLYWKGTTSGAQTIGINLAAADTVNYVAMARHNFGTIGAEYFIESSSNGVDWTALTTAAIPANDNSIITEFDDEFAKYFRVNIGAGSDIPEIGVLYIGAILRLQRRIYVGHTPITYGRRSKVSTSFSEDGQFLGRIVERRMYESAISQQNVLPDFYRSEIEPFFHDAVERPFFVAWRPVTYPTETGYAWLTGDPQMSNQRANGMVNIEFAFQGIR